MVHSPFQRYYMQDKCEKEAIMCTLKWCVKTSLTLRAVGETENINVNSTYDKYMHGMVQCSYVRRK